MTVSSTARLVAFMWKLQQFVAFDFPSLAAPECQTPQTPAQQVDVCPPLQTEQ